MFHYCQKGAFTVNTIVGERRYRQWWLGKRLSREHFPNRPSDSARYPPAQFESPRPNVTLLEDDRRRNIDVTLRGVVETTRHDKREGNLLHGPLNKRAEIVFQAREANDLDKFGDS
jgi:hypothetical protein